MKNSVALEVKGLSKSFRLPMESTSELKRVFVNWMKGVKGYKEQNVIRDISFTVNSGDFFGIVGKNGSGKSTLLKLISGIYSPDNGEIDVHGKLVPFIELGVGFSPELTGRENVYLNGALLGFTTDEIDVMYDEIVSFAELHDFMGQKLKNYSSGMQVRLAFSIAIRAKSDILVLDEVLAVGDEAFQRKCNDYFEEIRKDEGKTVILVTHSMESVRKYCNKALFLSNGKVRYMGDPAEVANQYTLESFGKVRDDVVDGDSVILKPISKQVLVSGDKLEFEVVYHSSENKKQYVGISLWADNVPLFADRPNEAEFTNRKGKHVFKYSFDTGVLNKHTIKVTATLYDYFGHRGRSSEPVAYTNDSTSLYFDIQSTNGRVGLVKRRGEWL